VLVFENSTVWGCSTGVSAPRSSYVGFVRQPAGLRVGGLDGNLVDHPANPVAFGRSGTVDGSTFERENDLSLLIRLETGRRSAGPSGRTGRSISQAVLGEFDPGSGRTLAACLTHASRAERPLRGYSSGERVSNTWVICPGHRNNRWKRRLMPDEVPALRGSVPKVASASGLG
jgi:hypothetical protein